MWFGKFSTNIAGISPKDFRKLFHPEPDILTNEISGDQQNTMYDIWQMNTASPRFDLPGGVNWETQTWARKYKVGHMFWLNN